MKHSFVSMDTDAQFLAELLDELVGVISEWYDRAEGRNGGIGDHRLSVDGISGARQVLDLLDALSTMDDGYWAVLNLWRNARKEV